MPTYIRTTIASDLSGGADFNDALLPTSGAFDTIVVSVAASSTETSFGFTAAGTPNNDDWETGQMDIEVEITVANARMGGDVDVSRINSTGTVQETSGKAGFISYATIGVKTFRIPSQNWSAGACSDRIRVNYDFINSDLSVGSVTIGRGKTTSEVISNVSEDVAACTVAAVFIPQAIVY